MSKTDKERLKEFRHSCHVYKKEKQILENAVNSYDSSEKKLIAFFREDVDRVDQVLSYVHDQFGASATLMIRQLFIEEKTQTDVAFQFGITRRQLQYCVDQYLSQILNEDSRYDS